MPRRGHWHPVRWHDPLRRTVFLDGAAKVPVEVNISYLIFSAAAPCKTVVFLENAWENRQTRESLYVAVCPRGHERELGAMPQSENGCACPSCGETHQWERE